MSSGQANIVAYSNLYGTTCSTPVPSVYWAYYSGGGKALTSPIISLDGTKVAFVENPARSGAAILRILAWQPSQGTPAAAATPTHSYTNGAVGAGGNTTWNTTNCPAGNSCMISVAFQSLMEIQTQGQRRSTFTTAPIRSTWAMLPAISINSPAYSMEPPAR